MSIDDDHPDQFYLGRQGPWPQPSPSHPDICADEVLNIPTMEKLDFDLYVVKRYFETLFGDGGNAVAYAQSVANWTGVSPERFDEIMTQTLNTRSRVDVQQPEKDLCASKFEPAIAQELAVGTWYKYDFTAMDMIKPMAGTYCAPVKIYFQIDAAGVHSARIIQINDLQVHRTDSSFGIACVYALQGAAYNVQFVVHPALHFPMDSVLAIARNSVPMKHPLFKLFAPHSIYTLPLDNAALESSSSVVSKDPQAEAYDPLTAKGLNLKLLFGAGYHGLGPDDGKQYDPLAYPRYNYMDPDYYDPVRRPTFDSDYGKRLADYYEVFLDLCRAVAKVIKQDQDLLQYAGRWADYCAPHVYGFPTGQQIMANDDVLANAMAIFIWNASVSHAADHWSYANQIWPVEFCMRIRRPPPVSRTEDPVNNAKQQIFNQDDMTRAWLCNDMFFQAWTISPNLAETDYDFEQAELQAAQKKFIAGLQAVNKKWCRKADAPKNGGPDSLVTCQPLVAMPDLSVPYERTIPQSIQY